MLDMTKEVTIAARVEEDLRDDLKQLAAANDRTFSQEIRRALRWYVLAESVKPKEAA